MMAGPSWSDEAELLEMGDLANRFDVAADSPIAVLALDVDGHLENGKPGRVVRASDRPKAWLVSPRPAGHHWATSAFRRT